jgi:hypothetical protein
MALTSPIAGQEPETEFFGDSVSYNVPQRTPIMSPIPGDVTVSMDKKITVVSPEGTSVEFQNVGTPTVTNGSKVNIGSQVGYTGNEKLKFTVYDKSNKKKKVTDFLKNTDPATLAVGGGAAATALTTTGKESDKKPKETDLGISTKDNYVDATDRAGFRLATGIGLAPFHLTTKAFGLDKQNESQNRKENLINEEIERIKKLMK